MADETVTTASSETPFLPQAPMQTGGENPVVRKYVIFESVDVDTVGEGLSISAGHNYASSKQATYDDAYCYVTKMLNGAHTRVDLSIKLPDAIPTGVPGNGAELNLTDADMAELRALCPYL
jgi:hypothetical protein